MDKFIRAAVATILVVLSSSFAHAAEKDDGPAVVLEKTPAYFVQVEMSSHAAKGRENLISKRLYVEHTFEGSDTSVSGEVYSDDSFESWTIGISQKWGNFSVGAGVGNTQYGGIQLKSVSSSLYYEDGPRGTRASFEVERYMVYSEATYYHKAYVHTPLSRDVFAGLYAETGFGQGLLIGMYAAKNVRLMLAARHDHALFSTTVEF